ncbi:MAG: carboxypeptidase-like regulatory domain-containing protein [Mariniblastus sp.]
MKTQLKKIGLSLVLAAMPFLAISTASAQLTQSGVSVMIGDSSPVNATPVTSTPITAQAIHTIALNKNGVLEGRVATIDAVSGEANGLAGLNVFFVRENQVIKQAQTSADGSFSVSGIAQGPYSFFAAGKSGIAAYGVYVTGQNGPAALNILEATTASANYSGLQQVLQASVPQVVIQALASASQTGAGSAIPAAKQIRLINNRLQGRISSLYQGQSTAGIQVQLIQNDRPIAQVQTDASGTFSVPDLQPGIYDFVAASQNGFAAGRFEAIGGSNPMSQVAYRKTTAQLDACLTCPSGNQAMASAPIDYAVGNDVMMEPSYSAPVEYAGESIAYGGASGGSCGACGNYSNFGGGGVVRGRFGGGRIGSRFGGGAAGANAGRLIMLGGLGAGILAIADDDPESGSNANN